MPGYFETMRLPLLRGRDITGQDDVRAPGVVIINERAASRYWPGEDAIGKRITFDQGKTWLAVIGIAKNAKQYDWAADPFDEVYLAALQNHQFLEDPAAHFNYITLVLRTAGNPADLASAVKAAVWSFDRNLPVSEVVTMDQAVADANAQPRFEMLLLGVFAGIALLLAAVGIYGVMTYAVARRTHEIGIRISLGASRADVLRMVAGQGMVQAVSGSVAGICGALALARLMAGMLYGVKPTDALTFAGVGSVLSVVALLAILVPARRATRIEPMLALRND
jgi:predicted permease